MVEAEAVDRLLLREGSTIGERHRVVRLIGRGGMGEVYEAENIWTGRRVAVKVLPAVLALDTERLARFRLEAQAATKLAHPNIIDVLDMGSDPATGMMYIVQELLVGETLDGVRERVERLGPREALDLALPAMGALAAAHDVGIIHRDVKPENIFVARGRDGLSVTKLIDFGLAKALDSTDRKTRTGVMMGTPHFMAPEQFDGDPTIDGRADVWAMGVVLYELLSGKLPFDGPTMHAILLSVHRGNPPRLDELVPELPRDLADVVHGALVTDRAQRHPTMRAFVDRLVALESMRSADPRDSLATRHRVSLQPAPPDVPAVREVSAALALDPSLFPEAEARAKTAEARGSGSNEGWSSERPPPLASHPPSSAIPRPGEVSEGLALSRRSGRRVVVAGAAALVALVAVAGFALRDGKPTPATPVASRREAVATAPRTMLDATINGTRPESARLAAAPAPSAITPDVGGTPPVHRAPGAPRVPSASRRAHVDPMAPAIESSGAPNHAASRRRTGASRAQVDPMAVVHAP